MPGKSAAVSGAAGWLAWTRFTSLGLADGAALLVQHFPASGDKANELGDSSAQL